MTSRVVTMTLSGRELRIPVQTGGTQAGRAVTRRSVGTKREGLPEIKIIRETLVNIFLQVFCL